MTDRYKLFHFSEPEMNYWTLIDRQRDPNELKNVFDDPGYADTRRQLHAELQRLRTELKVPAQDDPASVTPKQRPGGKKKGGAKKK